MTQPVFARMTARCHLCGTVAPLVESHVIPAFVMRWLKDTSHGGIRVGATPNVRVQDGPKEYYLCEDCEQKFGKWEGTVAARLFAPLHDETSTPPLQYPYHSWFLKFAVSVSWRVILHYREKRGFADLTPQLQARIQESFENGRDYLLGTTSYPVRFQHHVVPLGLIDAEHAPMLSPFFNRYVTRTVDHDLPHTKDALMVYTKLGKFALFGFVSNCRHSEWCGTKIRARNGALNPSGRFSIPTEVLTYLSSKADETAAALASMSQRQKRKVSAAIESVGFGSASFRAF